VISPATLRCAVADLIKLSRMSIFERFGIMLDLEIKTIGFKNKELFPYD